MSRGIQQPDPQLATEDWVSFPGGELEGKRPKAVCRACRDAMDRGITRPPRMLCFQCYRLELERERALRAAATLDTGSEERFQSQLPFEQVNRARLAELKAARADARAADRTGVGACVDKRRRAQIAARRALQQIAAGIEARRVPPDVAATRLDAAAHAAELQLPEAWLPFVFSR
ncbi:MAG TPA: hypothetical protein VKE96_24985 [Vicinamibacterales bacterium]|nr:hypothetical protein [Vicinamibacterales bacterium]